MRNAFIGTTILAVATMTGCNQGKPGGPGVNAEKTSNFRQTDDTFHLSVPRMSSSVQQGTQAVSTVGIKRAKNFDEDVSLSFLDLPEGVTVKPAKPMIKHGDTDTSFEFHVADKVAVGDYTVKIIGQPNKGADAQVDFKLSIAAKDSFTLVVPRLSTSLKQGETKTVTIGINRDKLFDQDVALKFSELPQGVTLTPAEAVIKRGDTNTEVTLTGSENASLGDFDISVVGHPANGRDASHAFKLTVAKP